MCQFMMPHNRLIIFLLLLVHAAIFTVAQKNQQTGASDVDPSTLDPTDFQTAVDGFSDWVDSKPYSKVVDKNIGGICVFFSVYMLAPACGDFGPTYDPEECCAAIQTFVEKGNCFCQPAVALDPTIAGKVLKLIEETDCAVSIPFPQSTSSVLLSLAVLESDACNATERRTGSITKNPDFLVPKDSNLSAAQIPTFAELFQPLATGRFNTSFTTVNVSRSTPSDLINTFSTGDKFEAVILYPSEKESEEEDPESDQPVKPVLDRTGGKFPIVVFSPGFRAPPLGYFLTMRHLASQGMIVISQKSTQEITLNASREAVAVWPNDVADCLLYLKEQSARKGSFLFKRVDAKRAATAGHSFGGIFAISAAHLARQKGINVNTVVPIQAACYPVSDVCGFATDALPELSNANFLFIAGGQDKVAPPEHSRYLQLLLPQSSLPAKVKILKGVNHCAVEAGPEVWRFTYDCGLGDVSPMEAVRKVQKALTEFLVKQLKVK